MTQSYLLFSSTYRNRLLYPNPADYVVPLNSINNVNSSNQNVFLTTNPISYCVPDYNFCWTNFSPNTTDPRRFRVLIISGTSNAPVLERSVNTELLGLYPPNQDPPNLTLRQNTSNGFGILRGFVLTIGEGETLQVRDIIDYDPTTVTVTLRNPFSEFDLRAGPIEAEIRNLSENNKEDQIPPAVFVNGNFLENSSNVYFDFEVFLYNVSLNEVRLVRKYQTELQIMEMCDYFSGGWSITDQYWVISRNPPMTFGNFERFRGGGYYNTAFIEEFQFIDAGAGYQLQQQVLLIPRDGAADLERVTVARIIKVGWRGEIQSIQFEAPSCQQYKVGQVLIIVPLEDNHPAHRALLEVRSTSLGLRIRLKQSMSRPLDMEGNFLIPVLTSPQYTFNPSNQRLHLSPNGTIPLRNRRNKPIDLLESQNAWGITGIRKVVPLGSDEFLLLVQPLSYENLVRFDIIETNLDQLPPYIQNSCLHFIVGQFSIEGVVPLNFTGTQITQSQMTCYEMTVVNLILPNEIINGVQGLLTSAYPYVFLEISNESMPSGHNRSLIYSNNPNSVRATYVCSISDVNNPRTSRFIKISSDGAVQVLKFSPFDNLRIRVSLPNGQTFETEKTDTLLPCDPSVRLQISALIEIKRLS